MAVWLWNGKSIGTASASIVCLQVLGIKPQHKLIAVANFNNILSDTMSKEEEEHHSTTTHE